VTTLTAPHHEGELLYLFTQVDVERLLEAAGQAGPRGSLRPHVLTTLLGLLANTGIRVGEAVRLNIQDVQLVRAGPKRVAEFGASDNTVSPAQIANWYVLLRYPYGRGLARLAAICQPSN
jgi:site-specific recombinase XerD